LAALLLALATPLTAADESRIPVFVRGVAATDGWTDPSAERSDSAKDLIHHVQSSYRKHIRHTDAERDGAIVIEVVERHMEWRTMVLTVRVTAGEFQTEFTSRDMAWRECALKVVKKIDDWAQANAHRLIATR